MKEKREGDETRGLKAPRTLRNLTVNLPHQLAPRKDIEGTT